MSTLQSISHLTPPRQERAAINSQSVAGTITAGAGSPAAHYARLGAAQRCLR